MSSPSTTTRATFRNPDYQRDIRYVCKLDSWTLGSLGIWPVAIRHASNIAVLLCNLALVFAIVPCILYVIYDEKDMNTRLKLYGLLAFCITAVTKYTILLIHRPKILRCIESIKKDWSQVKYKSDREVMRKCATTGRNLAVIGVSLMYVAGGVYHFIAPFCIEHKVGNRTVRPFIYPPYSALWQPQISPIYEMMYIAHCMCGYTIYTITAGVCSLAALFTAHVCGQIEVIVSRLEYLLDDESFEQIPNVDQRIAVIVKGHVRVLRFAAVVEDILQEACLVEFVSCVCTICLLEYYCMTGWEENIKIELVTYFLLFVSLSFNVYTLCYIGELLMEKGNKINSMCCTINWYQLSPTSARCLILIIAMSGQPINISAGKMVDLSLTTFGNVLKTSVVYLSFLQTLVV